MTFTSLFAAALVTSLVMGGLGGFLYESLRRRGRATQAKLDGELTRRQLLGIEKMFYREMGQGAESVDISKQTPTKERHG